MPLLKSHFNPFPEWALTDVMMKSVGSRNFPSSSHRGAGWVPLCTMQFKVPLCTMHYAVSFPLCMPSHHFSINTSCSIRKVRMSYKGSVEIVLVGGGRGWCRTLITLNTKYSIDGAGRGRRHVFNVIEVLPKLWTPTNPSQLPGFFSSLVNMQICSIVLLECSFRVK